MYVKLVNNKQIKNVFITSIHCKIILLLDKFYSINLLTHKYYYLGLNEPQYVYKLYHLNHLI